MQLVGTTFMYIDSGIDTGQIIHQIRARFNFSDNIHQVGNRLIKDSFIECLKLIKNFDKIKIIPQIKMNNYKERYYKKKDFTEDSLKLAYKNISNGSIKAYLKNKDKIDLMFPIINNKNILS